MGQILVMTREYGACPDLTRGKDELTHHLVLKLLQHDVACETKLEAALAAQHCLIRLGDLSEASVRISVTNRNLP
jgi:hypothetical protein